MYFVQSCLLPVAPQCPTHLFPNVPDGVEGTSNGHSRQKRLMGVSIYSRRLMCQQVSLCGTLRSPPPPLGDPSRGPPGHLLLAGWGTLPRRAPHDQAISFLGLAARGPMGWRLGPPSNELFHSRHRAGLISSVRRLLYQRCTTVCQAMSF